MPRPMLTFACVCVATTLLALTSVEAYPKKWSFCTPPPTAQGGHYVGSSTRLLKDGGIKFALYAKNKAVNYYCPGGTYTLKITWPTRRHAFITTNQGSFTPNDGCGGKRFRFPNPTRTTGWAALVKFPCGARGATVVKVVTAEGESSPFRQLSATFKIGTAAQCRAIRCPARG